MIAGIRHNKGDPFWYDLRSHVKYIRIRDLHSDKPNVEVDFVLFVEPSGLPRSGGLFLLLTVGESECNITWCPDAPNKPLVKAHRVHLHIHLGSQFNQSSGFEVCMFWSA